MTNAHQVRTRICVIFNPTARGEGAQRVLARLRSLESHCALKPTVAAGTARPLAAEAVREGYETIVAMGGDGTVHEVLNGMADIPEGLACARLAVLPVGTVNVFARELKVPLHFERAWEVICRGREVTIDVPRVEYCSSQGPQCRWFAQMAGCGLDARAVELMDWELKKRIGQFAYLVSGMKALQEKGVRIRVTDGSRSYEGELVLLGNGRLYGGSIPLFDQAKLQDGLVDVCVFPKVNWFVVLRYACAFLSPRLLTRGRENHFQAKSVMIDSLSPAPLELDGEHVGHTPVKCSVHPRVLRVVVP